MTDSRGIVFELRGLWDDLQHVPDSYLKAIAEDGIDPDESSISYSNEGRRRVVGNLGQIRAMGRAITRIKAFADLLLEDEGPDIALPASFIRAGILRLTRDALAEVKLQAAARPEMDLHRVLDRVMSELTNAASLPWEAVPGAAVRTCTGCGCTDARACEGGCYWVGPTLCSRCGAGAHKETADAGGF